MQTNNYHRIIHLINTLGYFKADAVSVNEQDLKEALRPEVITALEAASNPPQPFIEEILRTLLDKGIVSPYYIYNDEKVVHERLVALYGEQLNLSSRGQDLLQHRMKDFREVFVKVKANFTTLDALKTAMYATADKVIKEIAEGDMYSHEEYNKNLLLNEAARSYSAGLNEAYGFKFIRVKNNAQALTVAPLPVKKEAGFSDAYISEMNMAKNYFILEVMINNKPYRYMFTPVNAMNITTGQHVAGQVILPAKCQFIAYAESEKTSSYIAHFIKKNYYADAKVHNLARNDEGTMKRVERMFKMAKLQEPLIGYTVELSKHAVLHFTFRNGTKIIMYPHYIYEVNQMQVLFANHVQDMTMNIVLAMVQQGLRATQGLTVEERESLFKTFSIGYDLRRVVKV